MNLITLKPSTAIEKNDLNRIFKEAKPHFNKVEGRDPIPPLENIENIIPELSNDDCLCLSIFYLNTIIGYIWVFEDFPPSIYILHFYISKKHRNCGFGKLAIKELENSYGERQLKKAELVVSANNYVGLKFWKSTGFDKIIGIYDVEQVGTNAIEIELQKQFENETDDWIHLLPVDEKNYFLGNYVTVTSEQLHSNLVLAIPEAIQAAFDNEFSEPYFICLNNEVIGYTALVFDQTIPNEEDRYWLWQFTVDKSYQNKGYGTKAMEIIVEQFRNKAVPVITLSTKSDNDNALRLYKKFGFTLTGETNGDEVILKKYIN
ncbi:MULTISPECIES: GNAT family N-acetyltransferase [Enterococcus]|uniref:GNAT family N-acetyltransferase n=3 Tax=Enterococcus TaxID=1350 RepID=UPI00187FB012|nr:MULTISPECIES: GNAT family N-acetyltransferase [Enterococcus]MBE8849286.1 GNAT family N-acetyltransferase [Enterococcus durans]MBE9880967.1 GNAT family N-acetyltransferase [Enterococcus casseliflavus]GMC02489.1 hypothetical protein K2F_27510 [Enterococcus thailandicus]